ncbi:hypothetical protein KC338_g53 [Hortaea werneckii]|nr:hypothetical protein KC338_g53 [Hortaea werneckii]
MERLIVELLLPGSERRHAWTRRNLAEERLRDQFSNAGDRGDEVDVSTVLRLRTEIDTSAGTGDMHAFVGLQGEVEVYGPGVVDKDVDSLQ